MLRSENRIFRNKFKDSGISYAWEVAGYEVFTYIVSGNKNITDFIAD